MSLIYRNIFIVVLLLLLQSTLFAQLQARKIDQLGQERNSDICARLDRLVIEMQSNPTDKAYIIFYGGRTYERYFDDKKKQGFITKEMPAKRGEAELRLRNWDTYLTRIRDVEKSRYEIINGGYREKFTVEFWLAPKDAKALELSPTLTEKDIKFDKGKPKNLGFRIPDC